VSTRSASSPPRRPGRPPGHDPRHPARRAAILEAACRAIVERGLPATRITDVASVAGTSTGTIHYYFETRDEVLMAALRWASERLFARVEAGPSDPPRARLAHLLAVAIPRPGPARDEYVLWIELWLRVLHEPALLGECETLSARWRGYFVDVVRDGVAAGEFAPVADADEVAVRLVALMDGLGFETALGYRWTSPARMHEALLAFAAEQLGVPRAALAEQAA
jgi:AcrR family transcriptional regulator